MGFDRVLAHIELAGDLAVAHALGDQFKDLEFAARDAEALLFASVRDARWPGRDWDFLHNDLRPGPGQLDTKPDAKNGKGGCDQSTVDFDRVFDDQIPILGPLQQGDEDRVSVSGHRTLDRNLRWIDRSHL